MNGICPILDCYFGAIFDPSEDEWIAVKVHRDGNQHELCRCATEEEAEGWAAAFRNDELLANSQFGMGA